MRKRRYHAPFIVCFLILFLVETAFCSETLIKVGASSPLIADLVKSVGGRRVEILLFPKWGGAKALFWMGGELEPKIYEYVQKQKGLPQESLLGYIPRIDSNPYEYFDALAVKLFLYRVSKVLKSLDPEGWGYYQRNLSRYSLAVDGIFRDGKWSVAKFRDKTIYTLSPHFSYLLKGLELREERITLDQLSSVKGIVIDNPDNPLERAVPSGVFLIRLFPDLSDRVNTYLALLKENIITLTLALSKAK